MMSNGVRLLSTTATKISTRTVNKTALSLKSSKTVIHDKLCRFLSTATVKNDTISSSAYDDAIPPPPTKLYSWGTILKGNIPVQKSLEEGKSGEGGAGAASNMLNRKGSVLDHPHLINLNDAFGIDNKSKTIKNINFGPTGTAVILSDNTCYTFGSNEFGELGHGHTRNVLVPTPLTLPDSTPLHSNEISQIELGKNFSAIIDTNGDLYTFGNNGSIMKDGVGCLGHGYLSEEYLKTPTLVESLVEDGCYASQVSIGNVHMTVLTTEGEVLTCGAGAYGRCGNLDPIDQLFLEPVEMLASESDIVQIEGGEDFTMALTGTDGIVYAWGRNHKGQCGTGAGLAVDIYAMEPMPMPVEGLLEGRRVTKVAAGHSHAAAITEKGELFTWGMGHFQPEHITALGHIKVIDVACGKDYTIAVGVDGEIYSFGKGKTGVLGLANDKNVYEPTVVEGLLGERIVKISAGWNHVGCLVEE